LHFLLERNEQKKVEREKLQENVENAIKKLNLKDTKVQLE